jgi:hypothetical protein
MLSVFQDSESQSISVQLPIVIVDGWSLPSAVELQAEGEESTKVGHGTIRPYLLPI